MAEFKIPKDEELFRGLPGQGESVPWEETMAYRYHEVLEKAVEEDLIGPGEIKASAYGGEYIVENMVSREYGRRMDSIRDKVQKAVDPYVQGDAPIGSFPARMNEVVATRTRKDGMKLECSFTLHPEQFYRYYPGEAELRNQWYKFHKQFEEKLKQYGPPAAVLIVSLFWIVYLLSVSSVIKIPFITELNRYSDSLVRDLLVGLLIDILSFPYLFWGKAGMLLPGIVAVISMAVILCGVKATRTAKSDFLLVFERCAPDYYRTLRFYELWNETIRHKKDRDKETTEHDLMRQRKIWDEWLGYYNSKK